MSKEFQRIPVDSGPTPEQLFKLAAVCVADAARSDSLRIHKTRQRARLWSYDATANEYPNFRTIDTKPIPHEQFRVFGIVARRTIALQDKDQLEYFAPNRMWGLRFATESQHRANPDQPELWNKNRVVYQFEWSSEETLTAQRTLKMFESYTEVLAGEQSTEDEITDALKGGVHQKLITSSLEPVGVEECERLIASGITPLSINELIQEQAA